MVVQWEITSQGYGSEGTAEVAPEVSGERGRVRWATSKWDVIVR